MTPLSFVALLALLIGLVFCVKQMIQRSPNIKLNKGGFALLGAICLTVLIWGITGIDNPGTQKGLTAGLTYLSLPTLLIAVSNLFGDDKRTALWAWLALFSAGTAVAGFAAL